MNKVFFKILKSIAFWALKKVYKKIDENGDGLLSKDELVNFAEYLEDWAVSLKERV